MVTAACSECSDNVRCEFSWRRLGAAHGAPLLRLMWGSIEEVHGERSRQAAKLCAEDPRA
eukprot:11232059-Prorocentrum_lima.AAC.1